jgi:hypothetical protein
MSVNLFLQVLALVALALAAFNAPGHPRVSWGWLGMFLWMATIIFGGFRL